MTEQDVYKRIKPLIDGATEGLFWDFKKTLGDHADIIKDILAFSNSDYDGDSYIIFGISEPPAGKYNKTIKLTTDDRRRLNTNENYIYLPEKLNVHGLSQHDISKMKQFSADISQTIESHMLISHPKCEYVPVCISEKFWLFVIIIKNAPGVFISKKDICDNSRKPVVKQGVLYVRIADTTIGADPNIASATEHIRVWKKYLDWLCSQDIVNDGGIQHD